MLSNTIIKRHTSLAILIIALLAISWNNISITLNDNNYHEEHRSLYIYAPRAAIEQDYVGEFLSSVNHPPLYKFIMRASQLSEVPLSDIHKLINLTLALLLLCGLAKIGYLTYGTFGAVGVALLAITQTNYFYQINSSTSHAFAFPLLAWAGYALYARRYYLHAILALVGGLVYPPAGVMLGASLTTHLVSDSWLDRRLKIPPYKLGAYLLVGVISSFCLYMIMQPLENFGKLLATGEQPENTPQGRLHISAYSPMYYMFAKSITSFNSNIHAMGILTLLALEYMLFVAGLLFFFRTERGKSFVIGITVSGMLIFLCAYIVKPALSYRFFIYPFYTAYPIYIFLGVLWLVTSISKRSKNFNNAIVACCLLFLSLLHDFSNADKLGYEIQLEESSSDIINFFREQEDEYLIAAWPLDYQTDLIPYLTGQPLFVLGKGHYAMYEDYVLRSRERVNDFIRAYFAKSISLIALLQCKYDIDYFVVNTDHFESKETLPHYFSPFDKLIDQLVDDNFPEGYLAPTVESKYVALRKGKFTIVDMRKLVATHQCKN